MNRIGKITWLACIAAASGAWGDELRIDQALPDGTCRLWQGRMSGNDPTVNAAFRVCRQQQRICGSMTWESQRSGRNVRLFEGRITDGEVRLKDTGFSENRPKPGWMFCLIDRYSLHFGEGHRLRGDYWSQACQDHASIDLATEGQPSVVGPKACDGAVPTS